jgi:hypothetical protein
MMRVYNLFRRKGEEDLFCAVPEDYSVPPFLTAEAWAYARTVRHGELLSGFDLAAAEDSVKANGFYVFHSAEDAQAMADTSPDCSTT